jgi:hypothetical protein
MSSTEGIAPQAVCTRLLCAMAPRKDERPELVGRGVRSPCRATVAWRQVPLCVVVGTGSCPVGPRMIDLRKGLAGLGASGNRVQGQQRKHDQDENAQSPCGQARNDRPWLGVVLKRLSNGHHDPRCWRPDRYSPPTRRRLASRSHLGQVWRCVTPCRPDLCISKVRHHGERLLDGGACDSPRPRPIHRSYLGPEPPSSVRIEHIALPPPGHNCL